MSADDVRLTASAHNPATRAEHLALAAVVRARRKALHLSQERLAELAGCDRQSVNRVEKAAYSPSWYRIVRLVQALGADLGEFMAAVDKIARAGR